MAFMQRGVALAAARMPKKISPRVHAALDYGISGSFLLADYSGNNGKPISYPMHGQIEAGLIAMTAAIPRLVRIEDEPEAKFFSRQALAKTTITGMTDFRRPRRLDSRHSEDEDEHLGI